MRIEVEPNAGPLHQSHLTVSDQVSGEEREQFSECLAAGIKAAQAGDRKKARTLLSTAAEIDPNSENAWLWLASISEYPEELLVFLNRVLEVNPENERALTWSSSTRALLSKTLVQRGIDAAGDGNKQLALECFDQALEYDEQSQIAWLWIASLADSEERKLEYLQRVLNLDPENEEAKTAVQASRQKAYSSLYGEACMHAVEGDHEKANAVLDKLLTEFTESEEAWVMRSLLASGFEEKMAAWSRLLELNPDNSFASAGMESVRRITESVPVPTDDSSEIVEVSENHGEPAKFEAESSPTQDLVFPESYEATTRWEDVKTESPSAGEPNPAVAEYLPEAAMDDEPVVSQVRDFSNGQIAQPFVDVEDLIMQEPDEPSWSMLETVEPMQAESDFASNDETQPISGAVDECTYPTVETFNVPTEAFDTFNTADSSEDGYPHVESWPAYADARADLHDNGNVVSVDSFEPATDSWQTAVIDPFASPAENVEMVAEHEVSASRPTVLVVDDSPTVRKLIAGKLEGAGYKVFCAESGREAAVLAKTVKPALVLLDIAMPKMDGYQVCRTLRGDSVTHDIPVVMISGKDGFYDEVKGAESGASGFITKPFGPETLMKAVESYLAPTSLPSE